MSQGEYIQGTPWVKGERTQWSPTAKLVFAFVLGLLALSPAILGLYWELFLSK